MCMDGMAKECMPTPIEEKMSSIESQASSLSELLREHSLEVTETSIYVALDEIRDGIRSEIEQEAEE